MTDHYIPEPKQINEKSSVYFDGSSSSTDSALIQEMSGNFNARIYLERRIEGSFVEVSQFPSFNLKEKWNTDEINTRIIADTRRVRIDNVTDNTGTIEVIGDEI